MKSEGALSAIQVVRMHDEISVKPNHDVIGEIFLGVPEHVFMIESCRTDAIGICLDNQLVKTDSNGCAKVLIHNGSQVLEFLVPDSVLGVTMPCPADQKTEKCVKCTISRKPTHPSPNQKSKGLMNCLLSLGCMKIKNWQIMAMPRTVCGRPYISMETCSPRLMLI